MSTEPHTVVESKQENREDDWARENREWLENLAESENEAAWVARDVLQSLSEDEEGDS